MVRALQPTYDDETTDYTTVEDRRRLAPPVTAERTTRQLPRAESPRSIAPDSAPRQLPRAESPRSVTPGSAPRKLPAFIPAETVMPTVSYRAALQPAAATNARSASPSSPPPAPSPAPVLAPYPMAAQEASVMEHMPKAPVRVVSAPTPVVATHPRGELTVVFGCRGGAGATMLAVNAGAALVRSHRSVCLVDLDLQLGDVCVALDLQAQTSLAAVAREAHVLDAASLRRRLAQHASGLCALSQVDHVEELDAKLPARMPALLDTLRAHFEHVIVDGVRDFGDLALAALEAATRILVVITQDVPSVRRAARVLDLLGRLGVDPARIHLIVNRAIKRGAIDDAAIQRALAKPVALRVREDDRVGEALDAGALLLDIARTRSIVSDVDQVATLIAKGAV